MATERTKGGREERWCLAQIRAPWAVLARQSGRLLATREAPALQYLASWACYVAGALAQSRRIARLLAYGDPL